MTDTSIPSTNSTSSAYSSLGVSSNSGLDMATLSPESVITYLSSQMNDVDGEVKSRMNAQQQNVNVKKAYSNVREALNSQDQQKLNKAVSDNLATLQAMPASAAQRQAITDLQTLQRERCGTHTEFSFKPGEEIKFDDPRNTAFVKNDFAWSGGWGNQIDQATGCAKPGCTVAGTIDQPGSTPFSAPDQSDWKKTSEDFGEKASNLGSQMEIDMIQIQSLMSKRQTMISLATNLTKSLDSGPSAIVGNIGH